MKQSTILFNLKSVCLFFWSSWFAIATLTNFFDLLNALGYLPISWHFRSGNYEMLAKVLSIYSTPLYFLNTLFGLDILVQGLSAGLFAIAFFKFISKKIFHEWVNLAFFISISLWFIFVIMEEIFIAYSYEKVHLTLIIVELISLLVIYLLPPPLGDINQ